MPRSTLPFLAAALLVAPVIAQAGREDDSDKRVRKAWSTLLAEEQQEAAEWFRLEVSVLDTFQLRLVRWVLADQQSDVGLWPDAEPAPFFDPEEHAPRQPIARKRLDPDHSRAKRARKDILGVRKERRLARAWAYDWGARGLVRLGDDRDPEHVFENALLGFPPALDLAEALVLRRLDRGEERQALFAFGHAYTDRDGNVYPGITLYDAWGSGYEIEMPDVDTLGIVHCVLDEPRRWIAPVPARKHRELYDTIGGIYVDARRYRGLREAMASVYLIGTPVLNDGYEPSLVRFHALWDRHISSPEKLRTILPTANDRQMFLTDWVSRCGRNPKLIDQGEKRREMLVRNAALVRSRMVWVLEELGAFERKRRPRPPREEEPGG